MLELYRNIRERRTELGLTQAELAEKLGYADKSMIAKIENGRVDITRSKIVAFARALECTPSALMGWEENTDIGENACYTFPIIGEVAAGFGTAAAEEETGEYEKIPVEWTRGHSRDDFFVLRVKGDSMHPEFRDGDSVLVLKKTSVDSGSVAVVIYDSDIATLKKVEYVRGEDWVKLIPINPEYSTKTIRNEELEQCCVIGEVRRLIRVVK